MNCPFIDQHENMQQSTTSNNSGAAKRKRKDTEVMVSTNTLTRAAEERAKQGIHELEISFGGELDLHRHYNRCPKNPGHLEFIPVNDLTKEHLPRELKKDSMLEWIKQTAQLTVKLSVNYVSTNRPPQLPLSSCAGQNVLSVGSGCVTHIYLTEDKDTMTCPFKDCHELPGQHQVYGYITIATAAHVVFDDAEAENTNVEFFYDSSEDRSGVLTARGIKVGAVSVEGDFCELLCVTHDRDLFYLIQHLLSGCEVCPVLYDLIKNKRELISAVFHKVATLEWISLSEYFTKPRELKIKMRKCEVSGIKKILSELDTLNMFLTLQTLSACVNYLRTKETIYIERSGSCFVVKLGDHKIKWRSVQLISYLYSDSLLRDIFTLRDQVFHNYFRCKVLILSEDPVSEVNLNQLLNVMNVSPQQSESLCEFVNRIGVQMKQPNYLSEVLTHLNVILNILSRQKELRNNFSDFLTTVYDLFSRITDQTVQQNAFNHLLYRIGQFIPRVAFQLKKINDFHELNTITDILNMVDEFIIRCGDKLFRLNVIYGFMDKMWEFNTAVSSLKCLEHDYFEFLHVMSRFLNKMNGFFNVDQIIQKNILKKFMNSIGELVSTVACKLSKQKNFSELIKKAHFYLDETFKFVNMFDDNLVQKNIIIGFLNKMGEFLIAESYMSACRNDEEMVNRIAEFFDRMKQIISRLDGQSELKNILSKFMYRMGECISHNQCQTTHGEELNYPFNMFCEYADKIDEFMKRFDDQLTQQNIMIGFMSGISITLESVFVVRSKDIERLFKKVNTFLNKISDIMKRIDDQLTGQDVFSKILYSVFKLITHSFVFRHINEVFVYRHDMFRRMHFYFNIDSHSMSKPEDQEAEQSIIREHVGNIHREISTAEAELNDLRKQIAPVNGVVNRTYKLVNDLRVLLAEQHPFQGYMDNMNNFLQRVLPHLERRNDLDFIINKIRKYLNETSKCIYEKERFLNVIRVKQFEENVCEFVSRVKEMPKQINDLYMHLNEIESELQIVHETFYEKYLSDIKQQNTDSSVSRRRTEQNYFSEFVNCFSCQQTFPFNLQVINVDIRTLEVRFISGSPFREYALKMEKTKQMLWRESKENYFLSRKGIIKYFVDSKNTGGWLVHISHPHGQSKHVTFGTQTDCLTGHGHYQQIYTASTCPGSSGGPVWMISDTGDLNQIYGVPHSGYHGNQLNHGCSLTLYAQNEQS